MDCKEDFDLYEFNIFGATKELCYEFVLNKHCFSKHSAILARLGEHSKNFIQILMRGPTAKVLVTDLTNNGFRALDLWHLAKNYDFNFFTTPVPLLFR